jgi:ferredoxin, 2Fe-2S
MPRVQFSSRRPCIEFETGRLPYQREGFPESVLDVALNYGVDLRHACGGVCACITCHVIVEQGDENLSAMRKDEEDRLYRVADYTLHSRLACQAVVRGNVTLRIARPGKNGSDTADWIARKAIR